MAEPYEIVWDDSGDSIHSPSYLQRQISIQYRRAPDGTVNLLVGPEVAVTGGIVEIHF